MFLLQHVAFTEHTEAYFLMFSSVCVTYSAVTKSSHLIKSVNITFHLKIFDLPKI